MESFRVLVRTILLDPRILLQEPGNPSCKRELSCVSPETLP